MQCGNHHQTPDAQPTVRWWKTRSGIVMCGFLLVAGFYLVTEHAAHLFGILPFLFILACPLMHLFHHHGHRKGAGGSVPAAVRATPAQQEGSI